VNKMLGAVNYLHTMDVCHRDLKLENFIFTEKGPAGEIKMIDFGFSKHYLHKEHMHEVVGTSYYIAPEVLGRDYTQKSDIWSMGVIIFMMLCGRCPFGGQDDYEIQENVKAGNYSLSTKHWRNISTDAKSFVRSLLDMNPESRPTASQALAHPWLMSGGTGIYKEDGEENEVDVEAEEALGKSVEQIKKFRTFSRLKKMALMSVAVGMDDREVEKMKLAFRELDTKNNGTISLAEFRGVMQKTKFVDDKDIDKLFADLDMDHTGYIKYSEFLAAAVQEQSFLEDDRVVDAFNKLDTDHNGTISRENLKGILGDELDDAAIDRMIAEADFHNDGVISLDEFRMMLEGKKVGDEGTAPGS
jgi:calcium-dependent protein kinase